MSELYSKMIDFVQFILNDITVLNNLSKGKDRATIFLSLRVEDRERITVAG